MQECSARSAILLNFISPEYAVRLRDFAAWCHKIGVEFDELTQAHADRYYHETIERNDLKAPHDAAITTLRTFELCRQDSRDWPQVQLCRPKKPVRVASLPDEFDQSFNQDLEKLQSFLTNPPNRRSLPCKPMPFWAAKRRIARFRLAATDAARQQGWHVSAFKAVSDLITVNNLNYAIDGSIARGNPERCSQHRILVGDFKFVGCHFVKLNSEEVDKISNFYNHTREKLRPAAATIEIVRALRNRDLVEALIALPSDTMEELKKKPILIKRDILTAERALAVGLLASAPIRPKNLASLIDGVHIRDRVEAGVRQVTITVSAEESKIGMETTHILAEDVMAVLDDFRWLVFGCKGPVNGPLFAGREYPTKRAAVLSKQLAAFMADFLERNGVHGLRITAHRFRAITGYIYLLYRPDDYESVRQLLGHKYIDTTILFYAWVDGPDAQKRNNETRRELLSRIAARRALQRTQLAAG